MRDLRDWHVARAGLIKDQTRLRNRAQTQNISVLKRQTKVRLTLVERQIAELDVEIATLIAAQENTARTCDILRSIPGVGAVSAAAILTLMPELGTLDRKQVASLAGLAPITRQSGQWQGKSFIGSGRKPLRDALYMPALVALRCNPDLKKVQPSARSRKTRQSGYRCSHAKPHRNRKRSDQSKPKMGTKSRLIKTDTLDLKQRPSQHGHRRHNTRHQIENGRVNSTDVPIKNGEITVTVCLQRS
jgi:transposase